MNKIHVMQLRKCHNNNAGLPKLGTCWGQDYTVLNPRLVLGYPAKEMLPFILYGWDTEGGQVGPLFPHSCVFILWGSSHFSQAVEL